MEQQRGEWHDTMGSERTRLTRRVRQLVAAMCMCVAAAAVATGCGGDSGVAQKDGMDEVTVGLYPVVNFAPLYLGEQQGFFKDENIMLKKKLSAGGAEIVPQLLSKETQIGFSNPVSVLLAQEKGLPIRIITQASQANTPKKDFSGVVVAEDSPIRTAKDLEGKTIAVNLLDNIGDVTIRRSMEKEGADPSKVKFIEIPFPDMNAALEGGEVDAVWDLEPFLTEAVEDGGRVIFYNYAETAPRLTNTVGMATEEFLSTERDVAVRFKRAFDKSLEYAQAHPSEARQAVAEYTEIDPAVLKRITLPYWSTDLNEETLQQLADAMKKYGVSKKSLKVTDYIEKLD